jgi:S1-C subfamily serine protease
MRTTSLLALAAALIPLACQSTTSLSSVGTDVDDPLEVVYDRVHRSVVTLRTIGIHQSPSGGEGEVVEAGVGSGVLVDADGHVLTAAHVVQTADAVVVEFADGTLREARVLGTVPRADLALVRVQGALPDDAAIAPLGDSDQVRIGSRVFVIGAPRGVTHTLTVGYLSARRDLALPMPGAQSIELLQTDAAINPGNSGGPMFDPAGRVVGIVSHIVSVGGGSEGLGFAVASNVARELLFEQDVFWSGIDAIFLQGPYAEAFHLPGGKPGAMVQVVARGSIGDRMGLRAGTLPAILGGEAVLLGGDVILTVLGVPVSDPQLHERLLAAIEAQEGTARITAEVLRGDQVRVLTAPLHAEDPD